MPIYRPKKGDFVALSFDPQTGHEQKGRRPALVVSNDVFNNATRLVITCPVTRTDRNSPFHVGIPAQCSIHGFIMAEQIKSADFSARKIKFIEKAPDETLDEVLAIIDACIY